MKKVLLVDANPESRGRLHGLMTQEGHDVVEVSSKKEASALMVNADILVIRAHKIEAEEFVKGLRFAGDWTPAVVLAVPQTAKGLEDAEKNALMYVLSAQAEEATILAWVRRAEKVADDIECVSEAAEKMKSVCRSLQEIIRS